MQQPVHPEHDPQFLNRLAFEQEKARRQSLTQALELSSLLASNRLNESQIAQDPINVALTLQKELRKSKQANVATLEKLAQAERAGAKLFEEWEKTLKLLESQQHKSQLDLEIIEISHKEQIENLKKELTNQSLYQGKTLADFEKLKADLTELQSQKDYVQDSLAQAQRASGQLQSEVTQLRNENESLHSQGIKTVDNYNKIIAGLKHDIEVVTAALAGAEKKSLEQADYSALSQKQLQRISELECDSKKTQMKLEDQIKALEVRLNEMTQKHSESLEKMRFTASSLMSKNAEITNLQSLNQDLENRLREAIQKSEVLQSVVAQYEQDIQNLRNDRENHVQAAVSLENELKESKQIIDQLKTELKTCNDKAKSLEHQVEATKDKYEASLQSKNIHIQTLTNEMTSIKANLLKTRTTDNVQITRERDSYRADMDAVSNLLVLIGSSVPAISNLFEEASRSGLGKSTLYPDAEHNSIVPKMQSLQQFLKKMKEETASIANFAPGSTVILQKDSYGNYEVIKNPELDRISYYLDPECGPQWQSQMNQGQRIIGSIFFVGPDQVVSTADNEYHLPKGSIYRTVYVQPLEN